jgi:hypothetical protein
MAAYHTSGKRQFATNLLARIEGFFGTIGSIIAGGLKMWISCDAIGCRNGADVDLLSLRDQLGAYYCIRRFRRPQPVRQVQREWP